MIRRSFLPSSILRWPPSTMNSYIPTWFQIGLAIGKVFTHLHYLPLQMKTSADCLPPHFQHLQSIHTFIPCGTALKIPISDQCFMTTYSSTYFFSVNLPVSKKSWQGSIHIPIPMGISHPWCIPPGRWIPPSRELAGSIFPSHGFPSNSFLGFFIFLINRFRSDRWWFGVPLLMRGPLLSLPVVWAADFPEAQARFGSFRKQGGW